MRAAAWWCVAVVLSSAVLAADDHSVIYDEDVDFSIFKTYTVHEARMTSTRPELNVPAVVRTLGESIRAALGSGGLTETPDRADLVVECGVTGVDYNIGPFGRPNVIGPGPRGGRANSVKVDFTEATMVIDLSRRDSGALVWRGVYQDTEPLAQTLADALPKDAAKLLAQQETASGPDLAVDYTITGEDMAIGVPSGIRGAGPQPVRYTEGTLVIDLTRPVDTTPVWRGVYRDDESTGSKLMQKLPEDATRLLAKYPRRTR